MWTLFNYQYRDASNYKVCGTAAFSGTISPDEQVEIEHALESREFFIAEQIGVPPLQHLLQRAFGGPNADDHCWHLFENWGFCSALPIAILDSGPIGPFVERFRSITKWNESLSPCFDPSR